MLAISIASCCNRESQLLPVKTGTTKLPVTRECLYEHWLYDVEKQVGKIWRVVRMVTWEIQIRRQLRSLHQHVFRRFSTNCCVICVPFGTMVSMVITACILQWLSMAATSIFRIGRSAGQGIPNLSKHGYPVQIAIVWTWTIGHLWWFNLTTNCMHMHQWLKKHTTRRHLNNPSSQPVSRWDPVVYFLVRFGYPHMHATKKDWYST
jgi:hypothetical protein